MRSRNLHRRNSIAAYEATNWLTDTFGWIFGYGSTAGSDDKAGRERAAPLNGPRTIKLLCDVHAHELFEDGVYNSDPHPGNVIMMPDRRLGLIDYGACATMSEEHREGFAKLLVAIAEKDDDKTIEAMKEFGITSTKNDRKYLLTYALVMFHRGFHPDDVSPNCASTRRKGVACASTICLVSWVSGVIYFSCFD